MQIQWMVTEAFKLQKGHKSKINVVPKTCGSKYQDKSIDSLRNTDIYCKLLLTDNRPLQ